MRLLGSCIHAAHLVSHGRRHGCRLSLLLARTWMPRDPSASIVPRQTLFSLLPLGRISRGTVPQSGHCAQQSGWTAGSWMGVWLCFGMLFVFLLLYISALLIRVVRNVVCSAVATQIHGWHYLGVLSAFHTSCHSFCFGSCIELLFASYGAVGGVV